MRALIAGGMDAAYDASQEHFNFTHGSGAYEPNADGFYALRTDFRAGFYARFEGRLVKVPWQDLEHLPQGDYRVLFLTRDPAAIEASMDAFPLDWGMERVIPWFYDKWLSGLRARLAARGDMAVQVLAYETIRASPLVAFTGLGWPIDPARAAAVVR